MLCEVDFVGTLSSIAIPRCMFGLTADSVIRERFNDDVYCCCCRSFRAPRPQIFKAKVYPN